MKALLKTNDDTHIYSFVEKNPLNFSICVLSPTVVSEFNDQSYEDNEQYAGIFFMFIYLFL